MRLAVSILGLAALAGTALAAQPDAAPGGATRTIDLELRENGRLIGAPTLTVQIGRPTAVAVGGLYSMRLRIDAEPDTDGDGIAPLVVRSSLFRPGDANWARVTAPAMTVVEGMPARAGWPARTAAISRSACSSTDRFPAARAGRTSACRQSQCSPGARRCSPLTQRTVPVLARITTLSVVMQLLRRFTPSSSDPSVTPVAAKITSPCARSSK